MRAVAIITVFALVFVAGVTATADDEERNNNCRSSSWEPLDDPNQPLRAHYVMHHDPPQWVGAVIVGVLVLSYLVAMACLTCAIMLACFIAIYGAVGFVLRRRQFRREETKTE